MARRSQGYYKKRVIRDLAFICVSAVAAFFFARSGILEASLLYLSAPREVVVFVAGMFFTSGFTILPATFALGALAAQAHFSEFVAWGALGAAVGDFILFFFVRDVFAEDLRGMLRGTHFKNILSAPKLGFMHWFMPLFGALIVASPLPDEIGLALMGVSRLKSRLVFPLLFILNCFGVGAIWLAASVLG